MSVLPYIIAFCALACLLDIAIVWALIRQGRDE
jgi:hypothetical protein